MKKQLAILILFFFTFAGIKAQQRAQYSNYVMNNYLLNPAVAGSYSFWNGKIGYRNQWVGMEGAPKTFFASVHGSFNHPDSRKRTKRYKNVTHHGIGAYVYYDELGPLSWSGAFLSYAYHIRMSRKVTTSLGVFGGLKEFRVDGDQIHFVKDANDLIVKPGVQSTILPDANVGMFTYSDEFFFGVSVHQILQTSLDYETKNGVSAEGKLKNHYFITGGYKFSINRNLHFYPTFMVKAMYPAPMTFDVNLRLMYSDFVWAGITYRDRDAVAIMAEYLVNDIVEIGYAYDLGVSKLRTYNGGTHEIIIGVRWNDPSKQVHCPAKFW